MWETEVTTPVSTDSRTPVLEIKEDQLCDEHGNPIPDICAYQFLLFCRRNAMNKGLLTIQDYLKKHPENPNYVPPSNKHCDSRDEQKSKERKKIEPKHEHKSHEHHHE
uniref:Uncharacterized protein n=1 Tax=Romanomermis culicivorax TaxID=13658 RepID=A0A915IC58_ROMCU